ncbi:DUF1858 domain-containing protein [Microvirga sp. CF3016]|uniref:DUF1858 domain-containing protein n=1 Tax=Microvirga sp. CF3016 TaxID=3110181 RepID=UPI002E79A538|nr:DUF1858 domain-containing protein [Microvirga sp. CF3016]MEE1609845.1 DUF1858 domain-containing protein [Microvirga sp. CF3016]
MPVEATHLVDDVMRRCPATIRVFLKHGMRCVGCPIGCFHTVDDACREHGVDRTKFMAELRTAIDKASDGEPATGTEVVTARWPAIP